VTPVARALAATTGDPALKLVLLCVAGCPGWPSAADIAAAAEIPVDLAVAALDELASRRMVVAHTGTDATRYGLPDDGWTYTRADTAEPEDTALQPWAERALKRGEIGGYTFTARQARP
jgi:hypothetical protein